jgi:hypothetical protein
MPDIDLPGAKEKLWHQMQADLRSLVPSFTDSEFLLCPACFRPMKFEDFELEHIIPKQALADDSKAVREAIIENQRSGLTLLCKKLLRLKEKPLNSNGCNGWKGQHFDRFVRELLHIDFHKIKPTARRHVSMFAVGYLALFHKYGYRVSLSRSGQLMRTQFFHPNVVLPDLRQYAAIFSRTADD